MGRVAGGGGGGGGEAQAQRVVQHNDLMLIGSHGGIGVIAMHVCVSQVLHERLQPSCLPETPVYPHTISIYRGYT